MPFKTNEYLVADLSAITSICVTLIGSLSFSRNWQGFTTLNWKRLYKKWHCGCFHISNLVIISCDFDIGLCDGWRQSSLDVFDWTRHTGQDSFYTGPFGDHTSGSGERDFLHSFWCLLTPNFPRLVVFMKTNVQSKMSNTNSTIPYKDIPHRGMGQSSCLFCFKCKC